MNETGIERNLCLYLTEAVKRFPTELAVSVQKKSLTQLTYQEINFEQLNQRSDQIAYALNQHGIKQGAKAVLMVTPSIDFFALTFALFKAGIIPILVDPGMGIKNLKQCFKEAKPDTFIGIPKAHIARKLFAWGKETIRHKICVGGPGFLGGISLTSLIRKYPSSNNYKIVKLPEHEMAAILFTSGSTGSPKGVVYSHAMFEAQINVLKNDYNIIQGERDLATFPLFSLFGPALGMASIVPEMDASKPITANPSYIFSAIEKYQCSNLFANPALIELLGQAGVQQQVQLPSLTRVISAGAPATLSSIKRFTKLLSNRCEVLNSYGATEALPISKIPSSQLLLTDSITDTGGGICVGLPVEGIEVRIIKVTKEVISDWHEQLTLAPYEVGEIVVKGAQVSQSYYQRAQATIDSKIRDGQMLRHRMGDLGYFDEHGKLWMCGRVAHTVQATFNDQHKDYFSISCERIFNTHPDVKRSALVAITDKIKTKPLICVELVEGSNKSKAIIFNELKFIANNHTQTAGIALFLEHSGFPMDIRHNAKIFREKLAVWAQQQLDKSVD